MGVLACFHFPLILSDGAVPTPGSGANPWVVSRAGYWGSAVAFYSGCFSISQGRRELAGCESDSCLCLYGHLNLLPGAYSLKANEVHGVQHLSFFMLCSSGDSLKFSTCWNSERTMPVRCWWWGSVGCPGVHFGFLSLLPSAVEEIFFLKGKTQSAPVVGGNRAKESRREKLFPRQVLWWAEEDWCQFMLAELT